MEWIEDWKPCTPFVGPMTIILTREYLENLAAAFDKRPQGWHVVWANLSKKLRSIAETDGTLDGHAFGDMVVDGQRAHLDALEKYLHLIRNWGDRQCDYQRDDFRVFVKHLLPCFELFGIPSKRHIGYERTWDANLSVADLGMKHDIRGLKGGVLAATAVEVLMCGNDATVPGRDDRAGAFVVDCLRGLLHYYEGPETIVTDVLKVFGDFGIRTDYIDTSRTEIRIQELYWVIKAGMTGAPEHKPLAVR